VQDVLQYEGRTVVVTGAASGMGEATARILADLGAVVHAVDIRDSSAPVASFHRCDLGDPAQIEATVAGIGGPVDSLFNCAGLPTTAPAQQIVRVNFLGHRHLTELLLPLVTEGGSVGFISSAAGMGWQANLERYLDLLATDGFDAGRAWCDAHDDVISADGYSFSKEAINAYVAWRGYQTAATVRINGIMPGPTDTPMMPSFVEMMGEEFFARFPKPVGRNSRPDEQAWALVMLNSPRSSYVAATNVFTDGGFSGGMTTGSIDFATLFE
jgi:NAD(P)-dependent dehydrogenase (short-subunit alcohol dehydrogenase family)